MDRPRTSVIARWLVAGLIGLAGLRTLTRVMAHADSMAGAFAGSLFSP